MKIEKIEEIILDLHYNKFICCTCKKVKATLNHELFWQNMHRFFNLNQENQLKPYNNMNTELKNNVKNDFEKNFIKLMKMLFFEKVWKKLENRDVRQVQAKQEGII